MWLYKRQCFHCGLPARASSNWGNVRTHTRTQNPHANSGLISAHLLFFFVRHFKKCVCEKAERKRAAAAVGCPQVTLHQPDGFLPSFFHTHTMCTDPSWTLCGITEPRWIYFSLLSFILARIYILLAPRFVCGNSFNVKQSQTIQL